MNETPHRATTATTHKTTVTILMRPMKLFSTLVLMALVAGCADDAAEPTRSADASLILINGRVYTLDWDERRTARFGWLASGCPGRRDSGWQDRFRRQ